MTDKIITKQVIVDVPIKEVWRKWTTEEGLKTFLVKDCEVELKIGGAFEMYFNPDAPPGSQGSEGCKILSFLPEKMLSFSWNAPPTIPTIRALGDMAWVVVFFEEINSNRTKVELNHLGFGFFSTHPGNFLKFIYLLFVQHIKGMLFLFKIGNLIVKASLYALKLIFLIPNF